MTRLLIRVPQLEVALPVNGNLPQPGARLLALLCMSTEVGVVEADAI